MPTLSEMFGYLGVVWHWGLLVISLLATSFLTKSLLNKVLLSIAVLAAWFIFGSGLIGGFILLGIAGALSKRHNASESEQNQGQLVSVLILLLTIGTAVGLTRGNSKNSSVASLGDNSSYDASQGLRGAVEKIPVPSSSKVIFRQDWNTFSMSASSPTMTATGYRWVLKSDLPIADVDKFYQSLIPTPTKEDWGDETRYAFKLGISQIDVEVDKKEGQFEIKESRQKY